MRAHLPSRPQRGAALLIILAIIGLGAALLLVNALNQANKQIDRDKTTASALAQAKEALVGFAASYGDSAGHASEVAGFLACPDTDNSALTPGQADPPCGASRVSLIGRLPWNTLGLSDLRDSAGECLWYAVAGIAKDNPRLPFGPGYFYNWDTLGQFVILDAGGNTLAGATPHEQPLAVVLAPRAAIGGQSRAGAANRCRGNTVTANYLDGADPIYTGAAPAPGATSTLTLATAASVANGSNNDQGLWITSKDIFDTVKRRGDFPAFVLNELLGSARNALSPLPAPATLNFTATPATESSGGAIVGSLEIGRVPKSALTTNALKRWQDNLLYARCTSGGSCLTVNGASCKGVVIFAGERAAAQSRASNAEKNTWGNYLEGGVLAAFSTGATVFTGAAAYTAAAPSTDVLACVTTLPGTQVSFAANFSSFTPIGSSVVTDTVNQTVTITTTGGAGGCFWYPNPVPLNGKTLRAHFDFNFFYADPVGGGDNGNGFTLSFLRGDAGAPAICGTQANMGALAASDLLGFISLLVENDVHNDVANNDPAGNHSAIMYGGNLAHSSLSTGNGYTTAACDGSAQGCAYSAADKFEESPSPSTHNQRVEIHTGYSDSACTTQAPGGAYMQIKVWTDCLLCSDISTDFAGAATASRCIALPAEMANIYFGLTGGVTGGANPQALLIQNFELLSQ
jgi:type II secretory pathway pseudopilin PulG